ncbi:MAG: hypothetical protein JNN18_01935 [Rubrivivax sp.]|jgi:ribosome-associated translation inhibitor RaiA|nr:hypothetical protein [Rubrivivax sp.]
MQTILHADNHSLSYHRMDQHLKIVADDALQRFGERVTRVDAFMGLSPPTRRKGTRVQCTVQAHVKGIDHVVTSDRGGSPHQAIEGALRKLRRAIGYAISRPDPRADGPEAASLPAGPDVGQIA